MLTKVYGQAETARLQKMQRDAIVQQRSEVFAYNANASSGGGSASAVRSAIFIAEPAYNISGTGAEQHNIVAGGGFVLKWGE